VDAIASKPMYFVSSLSYVCSESDLTSPWRPFLSHKSSKIRAQSSSRVDGDMWSPHLPEPNDDSHESAVNPKPSPKLT
jgi:hypothetical protein